MSYSQDVTLKLTIKGTLNGLKTIINARDLNKLLDTAEGRATLLDKGRFEMREVSHARTMDASPDATFIDWSQSNGWLQRRVRQWSTYRSLNSVVARGASLHHGLRLGANIAYIAIHRSQAECRNREERVAWTHRSFESIFPIMKCADNFDNGLYCGDSQWICLHLPGY